MAAARTENDPTARSVGARDVAEWRSRTGRRLAEAHRRVAARRSPAAATAAVLAVGGAVMTALVVGFSRVLLGAHWFTDVLTGWASGTGWLAMVVTAHRLYLTADPNRPSA